MVRHQQRKNTKFVGLLILLFILISILFIYLRKSSKIIIPPDVKLYLQNEEPIFDQTVEFKGDKIVHLDLKGAPPKISYYRKIFPLLSKLGATGLLIEYEDMFPYSGTINNIPALNAYTLDDIKVINKLAEENNLKVIPLVQTFGHLEFVLKLSHYQDFREISKYTQVICPTKDGTLSLITNMITQVMKAHPKSNTLHIGADEVTFLGNCDSCQDFMAKKRFNKNSLFLYHIKNVVTAIRKVYPNLRILMWDDMFRSIKVEEFTESYLGENNIEPVVWKYSKEVYEELGPSLWQRYSKMFPKLWIASAFKGATGINQYLSDVTHYVQNHRSWLTLVAEQKNTVNFEGIIITGWQRYNHFAVLCQLFPVGIPALAMSLRVLLGYNDSPLSPPREVAKMLQCDQPYALIGSVFGTPKCSFPGGNVLEYILHFQQFKQEFETLADDTKVLGMLSDYNVDQSYSSPFYVEQIMDSLDRIRSELSVIEMELTNAMMEVYDNYTVTEWKSTYITPVKNKIDFLYEGGEKIVLKSSWPRRPLLHDEN